MVLAAATTSFGIFILAKCSKYLTNPRHSSFFTLCSITYPSLSLLFDFAMFVQCFGVGLSYLVLVGDLFPGLLGGNRDWWILGSALLIIPLCLLRHLDSLKYSSILGLFALAYLVTLVIGTFVYGVVLHDDYKSIRGDVFWVKVYDYNGLISTFSIIIFAYTCTMNIFSIINELTDNSVSNVTKVANSSIGIATFLILSVGITGYLTFGSNVLGNIILNYDPDSIWTRVGKFCLGCMVVLSFPLMFHPCRLATNNMVHWLQVNYGHCETHQTANNDHIHEARPISMVVADQEDRQVLGVSDTYGSLSGANSNPQNDEEEQREIEDNSSAIPFSERKFYTITAILLLALYALALRVTSFALVLALAGATGSTSISFTLPGLFGYKLIGSDALVSGRLMTSRDRFYKNCSLVLAWYGVIVMCISLYVTLYYGA